MVGRRANEVGVPEERRVIRPEPLSEEAWAPFGWLPVADTDPKDGRQTMAFEWADPHVNIIGHARTEVPETDRVAPLRDALPARQPHPNHHVPGRPGRDRRGAQPTSTFTPADDAERIRVFRLEPLQPLVLHRGTWHWGPFPVEADRVRLFNVQGLRYAEDNACVDLAGKGLGRRGGAVLMERLRRGRTQPSDLDGTRAGRGHLRPPRLTRVPMDAGSSRRRARTGGQATARSGAWWWPRRWAQPCRRCRRASMCIPCTATSCARAGQAFLSLHRVESTVRDGRSFTTREVISEVEGKQVFRMMCQFHVPEDGDEYQLPMAPGVHPPDEVGESEARTYRSRCASSAPTEQREDGTYRSTRRVLVPGQRAAGGRSEDPRLPAGVLLGHDRCRLPPSEPRDVGDPHGRQPRPRGLVPPPLAGRRVEHLRPAGPGQRGWPRHHPRHDARRGRHFALEHGARALDPGAR